MFEIYGQVIHSGSCMVVAYLDHTSDCKILQNRKHNNRGAKAKPLRLWR